MTYPGGGNIQKRESSLTGRETASLIAIIVGLLLLVVASSMAFGIVGFVAMLGVEAVAVGIFLGVMPDDNTSQR